MCGIAGILRVHPPGPAGTTPPPHFESIPEAWLDLLDDSIKHRGPDGQGRFRDRAVRADGSIVDVAVIHRRLSILDHKGGAQPMVTHSPSFQAGAGGRFFGATGSSPASDSYTTFPLLFQGSPTAAVRYEPIAGNTNNLLAVTFNGCIYNHRELRKELEAKGHKFVTDHSDTEVLLHGWREWRFDLLDRLEGMYAVAMWDRQEGDVVLLSDCFAEKPIYHDHGSQHDNSHVFVWSSSCAGLVRLQSQLTRARQNDEVSSLAPWIRYGWNMTTPFKNVWPVGHASGRLVRATFQEREGASSIRGLWDDSLNPKGDTLDEKTVDSHLRQAVHSRLDADVPLGVFLSGGIDSALIAKYAAEIRPDLTAFTVRMPSPDFDESKAATLTASTLGIRHEILDCHPDAANDLVQTIEQLGLPFGDSSLLPTIWLCRAAKPIITVALGGDGGDELFLGYERHAIARTLAGAGLVGTEALTTIAEKLEDSSNPKSRRTKLARFCRAAAGNGYKDLLAIFPPHLADQLLGSAAQPRGTWDGHFGMVFKAQGTQTFDQHFAHARRLDALFYLPLDLLRKSDTASMSVALELRSPMLDSTVARLAINASRQSLMPRGQRKGLLRAVARRYLPKEIVDRPKMGFAIPVGEWFRSDFGQMRTLLMDMLHSADPFPADLLGLELNRKFIDQMLAEHMESRRDHSQRLYMLLVLAIWCRWLRRIRGEAPVPPHA